jgi:hypothetical protein
VVRRAALTWPFGPVLSPTGERDCQRHRAYKAPPIRTVTANDRLKSLSPAGRGQAEGQVRVAGGPAVEGAEYPLGTPTLA